MKVDIYGASWCSSCKSAVELCKSKNISYEYIDVDVSSNLRLLESKLGARVKSIPQIFIDDRHLANGFTGLTQELAKN